MVESEAAETVGSSVQVQYFWLRESEKVSVDSIADAIEEIKATGDPPHARQTKILVDDEVVYFSERNGSIERWEKEWERQKRKMSLAENTHDCPHGTDACFENDLCIECKLDSAKSRAKNGGR